MPLLRLLPRTSILTHPPHLVRTEIIYAKRSRHSFKGGILVHRGGRGRGMSPESIFYLPHVLLKKEILIYLFGDFAAKNWWFEVMGKIGSVKKVVYSAIWRALLYLIFYFPPFHIPQRLWACKCVRGSVSFSFYLVYKYGLGKLCAQCITDVK